MVMGAMGALELTAPPAGSPPLLSGRAPGTRVLVLGGGISGLATAYELGKLGYDVQVVVWNRASWREEELTADYALSCLPHSVLRELDVSLSPDLAQAVAEEGDRG